MCLYCFVFQNLFFVSFSFSLSLFLHFFFLRSHNFLRAVQFRVTKNVKGDRVIKILPAYIISILNLKLSFSFKYKGNIVTTFNQCLFLLRCKFFVNLEVGHPPTAGIGGVHLHVHYAVMWVRCLQKVFC